MRTKRNQIRFILILALVAAGALLLGVFILAVEFRELIRDRQNRIEISRAIAGAIKAECARYKYQESDRGTGSGPTQDRNELKSRLAHNLAGRFGFQARYDYEIIDADGRVFLSSLKAGRLKFPLARENLDFAGPPWLLRVSFHGHGPPLPFLTTRRIAMGLIALLVMGAALLSVRLLRHDKELARLKTQFVSHVSHEMRAPAATIAMIAEMFKMGKVRDKLMADEYYDMLISESQRLTVMINNALDFARIESRRKTYAFSPCDPRKITLDAINLFKSFVIAKDCRIKYDLETGLPWINADAGGLTQAVCNLLDNAAKYSPDKKEIEVRLFLRADRLTLEVEDHGIGIDPRQQKEIFEPFYRVADASVNKIPGAGVGLAIVKHVIEAHKGEIIVNSRPGRGSVFSVLLPVGEEGT